MIIVEGGMMKIKDKHSRILRNIGRYCGWLAIGLLLFTLLTGYGISEFRTVETLTFGLLNKAVAHRMHAYTEVPMVLLLGVHIGIAVWARRKADREKKERMAK
jgi:uncharacterized membrane protein